MNFQAAPQPPDPNAILQLTEPTGELAKFLHKYRHNRVLFVQQVLGAAPEPWQKEALRAMDRGETRISVRSGHGVGKTAYLAWSMIHFLLHFYPCKIAITAPSSSQLHDAALPEIKTWIERLPPVYRQQIEVTSDRIYMSAAPAEAFISARTARADNPEALQGIHSDNVLLIADEASGVPEQIYQAAVGSLSTPGAIFLLTSNPTKRSGYFYNTHTKWADRWHTIHVPCAASSRVDPSFIQTMREDFGEDSAVYSVRVLGNFPPSEDDTFIPYFLIEDAMHRDIKPDLGQPTVWGVDPARFGDDSSVLAKRQGHFIYPTKSWKKLDTMQLASHIWNEYQSTPPELKPTEIYVDAIGIGAGVADRLRQFANDDPLRKTKVIDINVSENPSVGSMYYRLRDELWGRTKEAAETRKLVLPDSPSLLEQLTTPRFEFSTQGKIIIESKAKLRARGLKSPDEADAINMTWGNNAAVAAGFTPSRRYRTSNAHLTNNWVL